MDRAVHDEVGTYREAEKAYDEALEHFKLALKIEPDLTVARERIRYVWWLREIRPIPRGRRTGPPSSSKS